MDSTERITRQIEAHERLRSEDRKKLQQRSFEERTELIKAACRAAQAINRSRIQSGLESSHPTPWPESTWELLKKYALNGKITNAPK